MYRITVLPENRVIFAQPGQNLMDLLRRSGLSPDAPCGGHGTCGKCRVTANGQSVLACQTAVTEDMTVLLPETGSNNILSSGISGDTAHHIAQEGFLLAFDLGTTTVVGYLLDGQTGQELSCASARNPQSVYGADVISRIQYALKNDMKELTDSVRQCIGKLTDTLCEKAGITPAQITAVSLVGNPAMEQIFLGISPENLAKIPFAILVLPPQEAVAFHRGDLVPDGHSLAVVMNRGLGIFALCPYVTVCVVSDAVVHTLRGTVLAINNHGMAMDRLVFTLNGLRINHIGAVIHHLGAVNTRFPSA